MKRTLKLLVTVITTLSVVSCSRATSTLTSSNATSNNTATSSPTSETGLSSPASTPSGSNITISSDAGNYYNSINFTKAPADLKTDLKTLISTNYNSIGYDGLKSAYYYTDVKANGKIWDMYSSYEYQPTTQYGNYPREGSGYNREHSVPQSWFNENNPQRSDLFHVYPTDGYVNNVRSNNPYGEVASATYTSTNGCKSGSANTKYGYSGTVFEPIDEYKGDFARTYFYFCTRYEGTGMTHGQGGVHFTNNGVYPGLTQYSINLLLTWDALDPVSKKEIDRNNVIYTKYQHNRNPFIDIQGLSTYLWGSLKTI